MSCLLAALGGDAPSSPAAVRMSVDALNLTAGVPTWTRSGRDQLDAPCNPLPARGSGIASLLSGFTTMMAAWRTSLVARILGRYLALCRWQAVEFVSPARARKEFLVEARRQPRSAPRRTRWLCTSGRHGLFSLESPVPLLVSVLLVRKLGHDAVRRVREFDGYLWCLQGSVGPREDRGLRAIPIVTDSSQGKCSARMCPGAPRRRAASRGIWHGSEARDASL